MIIQKAETEPMATVVPASARHTTPHSMTRSMTTVAETLAMGLPMDTMDLLLVIFVVELGQRPGVCVIPSGQWPHG